MQVGLSTCIENALKVGSLLLNKKHLKGVFLCQTLTSSMCANRFLKVVSNYLRHLLIRKRLTAFCKSIIKGKVAKAHLTS